MKKIILYISFFLIGWFGTISVFGALFAHHIEVKIPGLVCSSCGIGIKNKLKKNTNVVDVAFDIKNQLALIQCKVSQSNRIYFINNKFITNAVKNAGYEVRSIKRLSNLKPNRYNKPWINFISI